MNLFDRLVNTVDKINEKLDEQELKRVERKQAQLKKLETKTERKKVEYDLDEQIKKKEEELKKYNKNRGLF